MSTLYDFDREYARRKNAVADCEYALAEFRVRHMDGDQSELSAALATARADVIYFENDPDAFLPQPFTETHSPITIIQSSASDQTLTRNDDGTVTIVGYGSVTNFPYEASQRFYGADGHCIEVVERGAFKDALAGNPDVSLLLGGHDGRRIAGTDDGSMTLTEDDRGLRFEARISAADVAEVKANPSCSFTCYPLDYYYSDDLTTVYVRSVWMDKLDVCLCPMGLNPLATNGATEGEANQARIDRLLTELDRASFTQESANRRKAAYHVA